MSSLQTASFALQDVPRPGDRFRVQVRYVDESDWVDSTVHTDVFPAEWAGKLVAELNEFSVNVVYRATRV